MHAQNGTHQQEDDDAGRTRCCGDEERQGIVRGVVVQQQGGGRDGQERDAAGYQAAAHVGHESDLGRGQILHHQAMNDEGPDQVRHAHGERAPHDEFHSVGEHERSSDSRQGDGRAHHHAH